MSTYDEHPDLHLEDDIVRSLQMLKTMAGAELEGQFSNEGLLIAACALVGRPPRRPVEPLREVLP